MTAKRLAPRPTTGGVETGREERYDYPFFAFLKDMNKVIDGFFRDFGMAPGEQDRGAFNPVVDVVDTGREITVSAELPGMNQDEIDVSLTKDRITLKGEKKAEREDSGKGYHLVERSYGGFTRSIILPVEVDTEKVRATFKNGVLTVTLPKTEQVLKGTKKVSIKAE